MSDSTTLSPREQIAAALGNLWWLPLLRGVLLIVVGSYALFRPGMTAVVLTQAVGIFVILDGILAVIAGMLGGAPYRSWTIARGVLAMLIGAFVFGHPAVIAGIAATVVLYVMACGAICAGILEMVAARQVRDEIEGEGWLIFAGMLAVLFGILLLVAPLAFGRFIVMLLGAYAVIYGISLIVLAFRMRRFSMALARSRP